ncbi:protocatechuate 3,4-dioxygenase subunit alpha [Arthrobacter sp. H14]|uniref:protocatechuate 3,4-dioxygenase subunit alpha n=1 Tax=Arthrobacter sp. H14 TaxID=1312959 RepID=UPI00047AAA34|nr:protocatechuate 3,4-dioxygenase subunit alpha [Arthrobacter sp. H14]
MSNPSTSPAPTPGQTVGPFFGYALPFEGGPDLVPPHNPKAVRLHGYVFDGNGDPIPDAILEIWQADQDGRIPREPGSLHRDGHTFTGFGRSETDAAGHYQFSTVIPGPISSTGASSSSGGNDAGADSKAPFIAVAVFSRGLINKLHTRIYLPGHEELHVTDPFLTSLDEEDRATVTATRGGDGSIRHDIHLQGPQETVFLAFD